MSKIDFANYRATLTSLSPIHIGSGNKLMKGLDFFYDSNKVGKVNLKKVNAYFNNISQWTSLIENREDIYKYLKRQRGVKLEDICDEILPSIDIKRNELHEFIRNSLSRNPIIPGSSVKGAVSTALLSKKLAEVHKNRVDEILNNFKQYRKYNDKLIKEIVEIKSSTKKLNPQNNIFKFLQIGDGEGNLLDLKVDIYQTLNLNSNDKWYIKKQLTQNKEVFEGEVLFNIRIDKRFWDNRFEVKNMKDFISRINEHTYSLIENDFEMFKKSLDKGKIEGKVAEPVIEQLENLIDEIKSTDNNSFIMRMSAGSGWDFMTGAWFKKITNKEQWDTFKSKIRRGRYEQYPFPKTRRLTSNYLFPGFVKITVKEV
jgi:CRISPR type III-A-associated RAMP protein Csm5